MHPQFVVEEIKLLKENKIAQDERKDESQVGHVQELKDPPVQPVLRTETQKTFERAQAQKKLKKLNALKKTEVGRSALDHWGFK